MGAEAAFAAASGHRVPRSRPAFLLYQRRAYAYCGHRRREQLYVSKRKTARVAHFLAVPREGEGESDSSEWSLYVHAELVHSSGNQEWKSKSISVPFSPRANPMWREQLTWTLPSEDELAFVRCAPGTSAALRAG